MEKSILLECLIHGLTGFETWTELKDEYGIKHTDTDMSSAEELAIFANEASDATKDIGDVGQSFGPVAEDKV